MKEIIALKEYTDKYISIYEGEIRNIEEPLAQRLIAEGIVAEHSEDSGEGGSGSKSEDNIFPVVAYNAANDSSTPQWVIDKTYQEVTTAINNNKYPILYIKKTRKIEPSNPYSEVEPTDQTAAVYHYVESPQSSADIGGHRFMALDSYIDTEEGQYSYSIIIAVLTRGNTLRFFNHNF